MFDWITNGFRSILGLITGSWQNAITDVVNGIYALFHATYGYHHTIYGRLISQWIRYARTNLTLQGGVSRFMDASYFQFTRILKVDFPWIEHWLSWLGGKLKADINRAVKALTAREQADYAKAHAYTRSVLVWVVIHVLGFLYNLLRRAFGWIGSEGATMWHYFSHLAAFAELLVFHLVSALEKHAWEIGKLLGEFLLALIVHNVVRFAKLMELIVDAVL